MSPEAAKALFWETMRTLDWHATSGKVGHQHEMDLHCWGVVIGAIRKDYEAENERLRGRVRDLERVVTDTVSADAAAGARP